MVATYSRVFRWNPVLALQCSDPFLPSSLRNSWKPIKTKSMSFPKAIFTAISATAHYHLCSTCQPGGVTHTCGRGVNWLNVLTESMYWKSGHRRGFRRLENSRASRLDAVLALARSPSCACGVLSLVSQARPTSAREGRVW